MRRSAEAGGAPAVQFRGGLYTLMLLRIADPRSQGFFNGVMEKIAKAPDLFRHAPVVLDLQDLAEAPPFNMAELVRRLRQHQLVPIGVTNGTEEQKRAAVNSGLSLMPDGREAPLRPRPKSEIEPVPASADGERSGAEAPERADTLLITHAIRSGQQVCAIEGDLAVLAPVSPGTELHAHGHIHVYGTLRGRAFAGVHGNREARIFCSGLEAELVSIAGHWRVREDMPEALIGKPAQVFLDGENLAIEPLL